MRRVRTARQLSQDALAHVTGYSKSYVSKIESGAVIPSQKFVEGCDRAFGTGDLFGQQLKRLTKGEHPPWFAPYIDAEREASEIRDFSTLFIMGLLQTPDYARASLRGGLLCEPDDLEAKARSRLRRREVLDKATPPDVWVVLCEACLWNEVGSPRVMADQMRHVRELLKCYPTLTVQVLPFSAAEVAISTAYVVLDIPGSKRHVFVEGPQGGRPYESRETVRNAMTIYDQMRAASLSPGDTAEYIDTVRSEHERNAVDQVQPQRQARRQLRRVGPGSRVRRRRPGAGQ